MLTITSSNDTAFRMNASTTATTGAIGFSSPGGSATTFAGVTVNTSKVSVLDANGTSNSRALDFSALSFGSDDQSISITANDSNGTLHTKTIILKNDACSRMGRSIDETLSYINTQLQQSNDSTLQKIVAVKENNSGAEQINFLSSLSKFSVGLGSSANTNALNGGTAATKDSQALGTGTNISIESKSGALAAVTRWRPAISTLGTAQAASARVRTSSTTPSVWHRVRSPTSAPLSRASVTRMWPAKRPT